jgi:hypothetical protein
MENLNEATVRLNNIHDQNAQVLREYSKYCFGELYSVKRVNADMQYNKRKVNGENVMISPFKQIIINRIPILSVEIGLDANKQAVILFNKNNDEGTKLRFPLKDPKEVILVPNTTTVAEACDVYDQSHGEKVIYFSNLPKLVAEVNALNAAWGDEAKRVAEEYTRMAVMYSKLNDQNRIMLENYKRANGCEDTELEIHIGVKEEEEVKE